MALPIEDEALASAETNLADRDPSESPFFSAEPHGKTENQVTEQLEKLPEPRESLFPNTTRAAAGFSAPPPDEEGLQGSVWRLDQRTVVNFARAQAAFILAQNNFIKDKDTSKIATAQHLFIEAQSEILAKFGVT